MMFSARMSRIALYFALFCVAAYPARALQLGETRAELLARHGNPGAEDHARNLAMYFWEGWSAQVEFQGDTVHKLTYRRNWYLQEPEINSLLQSNGGLTRWRETSTPTGPARQWSRDDGAFASCARTRPLSIVFESGLVFADSPLKPKVATPATTNSTSTSAPNFPKQLGAVPEPDLPVADKPTPVPTAAPTPGAAPRPLPKLPAEEIEPAAPPVPAAETVALTPLPRSVPEAAAQSVSEAKSTAAPQPPQSLATLTHGLAYTLGVLALLTLSGAGIYFFKRRSLTVPTRPAVVRDADSAPTASSALPGLDTLRWDQFELLVGEIFRREGYAVELSAAMGSDDGIDLTLRRDSETILVQSKYWKTAEVSTRQVQEFYGAMAACGAPRGIFVTTGEFTSEARQFAEGKGIELMDGTALAGSIAAAAKPGENLCVIGEWLEDFVAHARIFDPECPVCHGTMAIHHNRANGAPIWNCRSYPRCPGRREPRLDLLPAPASR